jgi:hypothetical protein
VCVKVLGNFLLEGYVVLSWVKLILLQATACRRQGYLASGSTAILEMDLGCWRLRAAFFAVFARCFPPWGFLWISETSDE